VSAAALEVSAGALGDSAGDLGAAFRIRRLRETPHPRRSRRAPGRRGTPRRYRDLRSRVVYESASRADHASNSFSWRPWNPAAHLDHTVHDEAGREDAEAYDRLMSVTLTISQSRRSPACLLDSFIERLALLTAGPKTERRACASPLSARRPAARGVPQVARIAPPPRRRRCAVPRGPDPRPGRPGMRNR